MKVPGPWHLVGSYAVQSLEKTLRGRRSPADTGPVVGAPAGRRGSEEGVHDARQHPCQCPMCKTLGEPKKKTRNNSLGRIARKLPRGPGGCLKPALARAHVSRPSSPCSLLIYFHPVGKPVFPLDPLIFSPLRPLETGFNKRLWCFTEKANK